MITERLHLSTAALSIIVGMLSTSEVKALDIDLTGFGNPGWIAQIDENTVLPSDITADGATLRSGVPTIKIRVFLDSIAALGEPVGRHEITASTDIHFVHESGSQSFRATVEIEFINLSGFDWAGYDIALITSRLPPDSLLTAGLLLKDVVSGHPIYAHIHPDNTPLSDLAGLASATDCEAANHVAFGPSFPQASTILPMNTVGNTECLIPAASFGATFTSAPAAFHILQHVPAFGPGIDFTVNGLGFHQFVQSAGRSSDFILHLAAVVAEPEADPVTTAPVMAASISTVPNDQPIQERETQRLQAFERLQQAP